MNAAPAASVNLGELIITWNITFRGAIPSRTIVSMSRSLTAPDQADDFNTYEHVSSLLYSPDLTTQGIESNPGPVEDDQSACGEPL
jgi:hypothetical protein